MRIPLLLIVTSISGHAMTTVKQCDPPATDEAVTAVRALNKQYIDAARVGDADWFAQHMADVVVVVLGSGRRVARRTSWPRYGAAPPTSRR